MLRFDPKSMPIAKIVGADTHFYHCDALGSARVMTDSNAVIKWQARYWPFGEMTKWGFGDNTHGFTPLEISPLMYRGEDFVFVLRFLTGQAGKEWDSEMGLNYFCQRYYDPEIGRFITLDPFGGYIELPQTQNRYAYCMANPLKYIDPLGLNGVSHFPDEYPFGPLRSKKRYGFLHFGIVPGLWGYAGRPSLETAGAGLGEAIDFGHSLNPPGFSEQIRQSSQPLVGWGIPGCKLKLLAELFAGLLDLSTLSYYTLRSFLPSLNDLPSPPEYTEPPKKKPRYRKSPYPKRRHNKFPLEVLDDLDHERPHRAPGMWKDPMLRKLRPPPIV